DRGRIPRWTKVLALQVSETTRGLAKHALCGWIKHHAPASTRVPPTSSRERGPSTRFLHCHLVIARDREDRPHAIGAAVGPSIPQGDTLVEGVRLRLIYAVRLPLSLALLNWLWLLLTSLIARPHDAVAAGDWVMNAEERNEKRLAANRTP